MTPSKNVQTVLDLCQDYGFEIVSFGLAPNPNGFCFEMPDEVDSFTEDAAVELVRHLNALSSTEEQELRKLIFG